jgi:alkanesulfonate monooxygenase SsuD/methylene tetrahydromethanopterin reductase-like flavin-dependent oxidoreductase (luciferase family)
MGPARAGRRVYRKPEPLPPVMVGAFKPKMLRLAARFADMWNVSSTGVEPYRRMSAIIDQACRELGRDPSTLGRSWGGGCACAPSQAEAEALAGDRFSGKDPEDFGFVGTPTQVVDQMRRFIDLGVDTFMLDCVDFPKMDMLELLIDKVLPAVNS